MANKKAIEALKKFEAWMEKTELQFNKERIFEVERGRFPFMADIYKGMTKPADKIMSLPPSQKDFTSKVYREYNKMYNHSPDKKKELERGVKARAQRTWASLVRQHHFELMLRIEFPLVYSSSQLDARGLDFLIVHDNIAVGLALTLNSRAASKWLAEKEKRNPSPDDLEIIVLYPEEKIGDFWVHGKQDFSKIREFTQAHKLKLFDSVGESLLGEVECKKKHKEVQPVLEFGEGSPLEAERKKYLEKA